MSEKIGLEEGGAISQEGKSHVPSEEEEGKAEGHQAVDWHEYVPQMPLRGWESGCNPVDTNMHRIMDHMT